NEGFIHHRYGRSRGTVIRVEFSAKPNRNLHGREESDVDDPALYNRVGTAAENPSLPSSSSRKLIDPHIGKGSGLDTRRLQEFLKDLAFNLRAATVVVTIRRRVDRKYSNIGVVETEFGLSDIPDAFHKKTGDDEQHDGDRNLRDQQNARQQSRSGER